mmetsp:Transcript_416/g.937  ORF Transcript_416/g.937 Transcript_416/m.937 type:complete len:246 (-) Transcript_416:180-917(-)
MVPHDRAGLHCREGRLPLLDLRLRPKPRPRDADGRLVVAAVAAAEDREEAAHEDLAEDHRGPVLPADVQLHEGRAAQLPVLVGDHVGLLSDLHLEQFARHIAKDVGQGLVVDDLAARSLRHLLDELVVHAGGRREICGAAVDDDALDTLGVAGADQRLAAQLHVHELEGPVVRLHHREHVDRRHEEVLVNAAPEQGAGLLGVGVEVEGELIARQELLADDPVEERLDVRKGEGPEAQAQDPLEGE